MFCNSTAIEENNRNRNKQYAYDNDNDIDNDNDNDNLNDNVNERHRIKGHRVAIKCSILDRSCNYFITVITFY